jgi:hypothetical protein
VVGDNIGYGVFTSVGKCWERKDSSWASSLFESFGIW